MSKLAVVTGGAGGMGLAVAHVIGRDSAVLICDVSQERLDAATRELGGSGIDCAATSAISPMANRWASSSSMLNSSEQSPRSSTPPA